MRSAHVVRERSLEPFDYGSHQLEVVVRSTVPRPGAVVHDLSYRAPGHPPVDAYLVVPDRPGPFPGAMFLHWLGEVAADRTQFVDEAVRLAATGAGRVSLLPQLDFPFARRPEGDVRDRDSVVAQVVQLRRGLDLLEQRPDVSARGMALIGHDYGGMYATILGAVDCTRVDVQVVIAADATFGHWFTRFFLDLPQDQVPAYAALFDDVDPIHFLACEPEGGRLLQYATRDFYITQDVAAALASAAGPRAKMLTGRPARVPDWLRVMTPWKNGR